MATKSNPYAKGSGSGKSGHSFQNPHAKGPGSAKRSSGAQIGKSVKSKRTKC